MAKTRYWLLSCGGRSPRTGKKVGERHRWSGGEHGVGSCEFCGRYIDQVRVRADLHPAYALSRHSHTSGGKGDG